MSTEETKELWLKPIYYGQMNTSSYTFYFSLSLLSPAAARLAGEERCPVFVAAARPQVAEQNSIPECLFGCSRATETLTWKWLNCLYIPERGSWAEGKQSWFWGGGIAGAQGEHSYSGHNKEFL